MRTLFVEAVPLGVNGVVSDALFRLDSVLLGLLIGSIAVGRYAAAYKLLETVLFINWSVARAVYPAMSAAREPGTVRLAVERGIGICGFAFFPYAALLLLRGGDLLHLLYGSAYAGRAAVVLAWLAPAPLAFGIAYLCAYALFAIDRPRAVLVASIGALVINVTANLALIPLLSDIGTAITTTGCYVVEAVVMAALLGPSCGRIRLERSLAIPAGAVLPSLAVLLVPLPVVAAGATELAVYLAAWALLSRRFDPQGLAVLTSLMPRRGRR
jgi:O-antigen/teichoic acid export membrane protein